MSTVSEIADGLKKHPGGFRLDAGERLFLHDTHDNLVVTDRRVQTESSTYLLTDLADVRLLPFMSPARNRWRTSSGLVAKLGLLLHALATLPKKAMPVRLAVVEGVYRDRPVTLALSKLIRKGDEQGEKEEWERLERIVAAIKSALQGQANEGAP